MSLRIIRKLLLELLNLCDCYLDHSDILFITIVINDL